MKFKTLFPGKDQWKDSVLIKYVLAYSEYHRGENVYNNKKR